MATYTKILYHVVFATKERRQSIDAAKSSDLYGYMAGVLKSMSCAPFQIGGTTDHVHLLFELHPTKNLAEVVKTIKIASGKWMKEESHIPAFEYWQEGYGAFTVSYKDKDAVSRYIANQEGHHATADFLTEFKDLLTRAGIEFDLRGLP